MAKNTTFTSFVPLPPEEVSQRLKSQTRFAWTPYRGGVLSPGQHPLRGRVSPKRFTVALNRRDPLALLQPTARGRMTAVPGGTEVEVVVGLPAVLLWYMRIVVAVFMPGLLFTVGVALLVAGAPQGSVLAVFGLLAFVVVGGIFGIGSSMNNVDGQVDALTDQVQSMLGALRTDQARLDGRGDAEQRAVSPRGAGELDAQSRFRSRKVAREWGK